MYRNAAASTLADKIEVTRQLDHAVVLATDQLAQDVVGARPFTDSPTRRVLIGVDPKQWGRWSRETARDELGLDRGGVYLFFGSHNLDDPRKGMDLLLSALRSLSADGTLRGSDVRLLVAGNCSDRAELDALGCPVHLLGYVNTNTLAQAYSAADFFVCPSIEDSGPMMVNEAMMSGTPVVGFPIGVLPDLVIDNETGVLAARKDAESLAMALANVLAWDESRRTSAREFCRRTALERCSLDAQIAGFTALADRST
jgi:glycosyltransferase involved in cell wall biosynthesis